MNYAIKLSDTSRRGVVVSNLKYSYSYLPRNILSWKSIFFGDSFTSPPSSLILSLSVPFSFGYVFVLTGVGFASKAGVHGSERMGTNDAGYSYPLPR